jgi:pilus assembly protein CpaB
MKPKTLALMVVAVGCGLAASYMTSRLLAERSNQQQVVQEKINVLVAKKNIPLGTLIKDPEQMFEEKPFIKGEEPKKAMKDLAALKDKRLNKALSAEQFVSVEDLMEKGMDGLGAQMAKGMRAYGIKVTADSTGGGFVLPNSRVDVVWVLRKGDTDSAAKIILQNVLVLAVDTLSARPDDKQAHVASTVTLAVTPEQAEKLSLAEQLGTLKLTLRPFGDEDLVKTKGANPKGIAKGSEKAEVEEDDPVATSGALAKLNVKVPEPPPAPKEEKKPEVVVAPPPPKTHTLTIYNGEHVTKAVFVLEDKTNEVKSTEIEKSDPAADKAKVNKK